MAAGYGGVGAVAGECAVIWGKMAEARQPKSLVVEPVVFDPTSAEQRKRFLTYTYDLGTRGQLDDAVKAILAGLPRDMNEDLRKGFQEYLKVLLAPEGKEMRPVYVYDPIETQQRMELAAKAVNRTEAYAEGQTLVQGDSTITETMLDLLRAERTAYTQKLLADPQLHHVFLLHQLGMCGVVLATVLGLAAYTLRYRPLVLASVVETTELALLLLGGVILCRWIAISSLPYADRWAIVPVWLTGSILAIATQQRYASGMTFAAGLLAVLALQGNQINAMSTYVVVTGATLVAIALLGDIRTRTKSGGGGAGGGGGGICPVGVCRPGDDADGGVREVERADRGVRRAGGEPSAARSSAGAGAVFRDCDGDDAAGVVRHQQAAFAAVGA